MIPWHVIVKGGQALGKLFDSGYNCQVCGKSCSGFWEKPLFYCCHKLQCASCAARTRSTKICVGCGKTPPNL